MARNSPLCTGTCLSFTAVWRFWISRPSSVSVARSSVRLPEMTCEMLQELLDRFASLTLTLTLYLTLSLTLTLSIPLTLSARCVKSNLIHFVPDTNSNPKLYLNPYSDPIRFASLLCTMVPLDVSEIGLHRNSATLSYGAFILVSY